MASVDELGSNAEEIGPDLELGAGARLWVYLSGMYETPARVTEWEVTFQQEGGNWQGTITSANPEEILQTPGLSGTFNVEVTAGGPEFGPTKLEPQPDSKPDVGCNSNCGAFVGIVADETADGANYWTVWDAYCK